jgi:hypothetical protein
VNAQEAVRAVEIADRLERRERLSNADRSWLANLIYREASEALQPKPAHRPLVNVDRNFWASMDVILSQETQAIVAARWNLEGKDLATIMSRGGWRKRCEAKLAETPDRNFWQTALKIYRGRLVPQK